MLSPFDMNYLHLYSDVELLFACFSIKLILFQVVKSNEKTFGTGSAVDKEKNPINIRKEEGKKSKDK